MAKKRVNKIEEAYKKFSKMKPEELAKYTSDLDNEMKEINEQIINKDKELEGRQSNIDVTTDTNKKDILIAQKETAEQEKADLIAMKNKKQKETNLLENWAKNKDKIEKIVGYKDRLTSKLKEVKKDLITKNKEIQELIKQDKDVDKKLKKSEELNNYEYNDLMVEKERIQKELEAKQKAIAELEKRESSLKGSISKCDLVWKNLMLGKSWDEIHAKAIKMNEKKRYTKKPEMKKQKLETQEEAAKYDELIGRWKKENDLDNVATQPLPKADTRVLPIIEEVEGEAVSDEENSDEKEMTKYSEFMAKHPKIAKMWNKIKNIFVKDSSDGKTNIEWQEEHNYDKPNLAETKTEEKTEDSPSKREEFVEQYKQPFDEEVDRLHQMVDPEYREKVRKEKEQQYKEMHSTKNAEVKHENDEKSNENER